MWYLLALCSAVLYAFRGLLEKKVVSKTNKYILGLAVRLFALPFFFIPFLIRPSLFIPLPEVPLPFWFAVVVVSVISTPIEMIFYYEALKEEELSVALPILSLAPGLTTVLSLMFLHEVPQVWGLLGIATIMVGIYALKIGHAKNGLLEPLRHLRNSRGVRLMCVVMLSVACGSIFDKIGVRNSNPFYYAAINYALVCGSLLIIALVKARSHFGQLLSHFGSFFIIGLFVAGYTLLYLIALDTGYTSYVISIRNASILLTIILGITILKEKGSREKALAGVLIFTGLILIKLFG